MTEGEGSSSDKGDESHALSPFHFQDRVVYVPILGLWWSRGPYDTFH